MSEPSPEAKQAAAKWWHCNYDRPGSIGLESAYAEGYDTATAKAQEELEQHRKHVGSFLSELHAIMIDSLAEGEINVRETCELLLTAARRQREQIADTAKLREELDVARAELFRRANQCAKLREALYILARGRWPDRMTQRELDTVNEALAHQPLDSARDRQQSAITTNEQAYRDGTLSQPSEDFSKSGMSAGGIQTWREASEVEQPSAPTADVEKIAQKLAIDLEPHWRAASDRLLQFIRPALVQARAPLVEELELAWGIIANVSGGDWEKQPQEWQEAAAKWRDRVVPQLAHRPLPRTEALAGRTGNNTKRR